MSYTVRLLTQGPVSLPPSLAPSRVSEAKLSREAVCLHGFAMELRGTPRSPSWLSPLDLKPTCPVVSQQIIRGKPGRGYPPRSLWQGLCKRNHVVWKGHKTSSASPSP